MAFMTIGSRIMIVIAPLIVAGCQTNPNWANEAALRIGKPRPDAAEIRARQTTQFPTGDEVTLLVESTQVLQDLGFTIEESAPRYGVLAGSKDRDATETGQVVGQVALTIGLAVLGVRYNPVWDKDQVIRATLTTRPVDRRTTTLRVSFERIVTNTQGLSRVELLTDPEMSTGFFDKVRAGLARGGPR
jgi:hypothetical protein